MLATELPLFPLQNVVLFPGVFLPLHIFELRYRTMMQDVLAGDRLIGVVLQKSGLRGEAADDPAPIYSVGCSGLVTHVDQLDDGRYNIVLRGVNKFAITAERDGRPYRVASVTSLEELMTMADRETVHQQRQRLEHLLSTTSAPDLPFPNTLSDEEIVNALSQYLEFDAIERQALLERDGVAERCAALIDLIEMRNMLTGHPPDRGLTH